MPKIAELRDRLVQGSRIAPEDFLILASHASGIPTSQVLAHPERDLSDEVAEVISNLAARRANHEPIAYLIGSKEFFGERFSVNRHTLIPRPETEILVEEALSTAIRHLENSPSLSCIDLGTGSGAIIVTLARVLRERFPMRSLRFIGSDISEEALAVARQNAERLAPHASIEYAFGSLAGAKAVRDILSGTAPVLITANLPYLSEALYAASMPDVRDFEPRQALVSGPDGLDHYRALCAELAQARAPFSLFLEISPEQETAVQSLVAAHFPAGRTRAVPDLAGLKRVFCLETPKIER